ncbi:FMN-dependent dehydrogenase [Tricladium varicosporioides]|nr:FMN-dependent dehydrogenase [Hymenoscyphus varicosporioides]
MSSSQVLSLAELEIAALQHVNKITREYWSDGAGENSTVQQNINAFDRYRIRPRALCNVSNIDMSTTVLGQKMAFPVGIAPSGWHKMANPVGEVGTALAAKTVGTAMGVSMGTALGAPVGAACSPEEIKAAGESSIMFFQLYIFENRNFTKELLERVEKAGYNAIMLTVDTACVGRRVSEIRNRPRLPQFLRAISFGSQLEEGKPGLTIDSSLAWDEIIPWLRRHTKMQIWLKGILTAEDAALAVQCGVDGIIVSNHGGRQLDACVATIDALPEIVAEIRGRIPVHIDGGIRRGVDVFRALALGANFSMLEILREELKICMGLAGCSSIKQITSNFLGYVENGRFTQSLQPSGV